LTGGWPLRDRDQVGGLRAREADYQSTLARAREQTGSRERMFADMKVGAAAAAGENTLAKCWLEGDPGQMLVKCWSNAAQWLGYPWLKLPYSVFIAPPPPNPLTPPRGSPPLPSAQAW
jgi:hypothetical protein